MTYGKYFLSRLLCMRVFSHTRVAERLYILFGEQDSHRHWGNANRSSERWPLAETHYLPPYTTTTKTRDDIEPSEGLLWHDNEIRTPAFSPIHALGPRKIILMFYFCEFCSSSKFSMNPISKISHVFAIFIELRHEDKKCTTAAPR